MKLTLNLDDASIKGLKAVREQQKQTCSLEAVASKLLTELLKDIGYIVDKSQLGTSPENLNSSNDD